METSRSRQSEQKKGRDLSELELSPTGHTPVDEDLVARRAYQRFEERGREDGHDLEDWIEAERELGLAGQSRGRNSN